MAFVQIIEFKASDADAVRKSGEEFFAATEGKRTVRRAIAAVDRNDPNHHFVIAFFDSYESAVENSNLPETQAGAQKMAALADGPPTFYDLDVVDDRS